MGKNSCSILTIPYPHHPIPTFTGLGRRETVQYEENSLAFVNSTISVCLVVSNSLSYQEVNITTIQHQLLDNKYQK